MVIHDNFADFAVFLYIHMAHADNEYHPKEQEIVKAKMKRLLPDTTSTPMAAKYEEALHQYKSLKREEISSVITDSFNHFGSVKPSIRLKVYADMLDIVNADGRVDEMETAALEELKQIINALTAAL